MRSGRLPRVDRETRTAALDAVALVAADMQDGTCGVRPTSSALLDPINQWRGVEGLLDVAADAFEESAEATLQQVEAALVTADSR